MRILFITHYYAPDSGAAANRLTRLAVGLAQREHEVIVLTTMPHYPKGKIDDAYKGKFTVVEERDGVRVIQVWLWATQSPKISRRLISQISFMLTCGLRGLFVNRPDVIFVENQPIFTGLAGWFISKVKHKNYVLNVSDYWPEYLVVSGVVSESSTIYRIFKYLTNLTQRHAHSIVAMLEDLLDKIQARIGHVEHGHIIQNAVDLNRLNPENLGIDFLQKFQLSEDVRWITFLGGLGPHIDLQTMLDVALHFRDRKNIGFLFVGSGAQKDALLDALADAEFAHCQHIDWIDAHDVPDFWGASYSHFWALHHNELDKMRFQAKLYEALATGTPTVIAVRGLMSEVLKAHNLGLTAPPYDGKGIIKAIEQLLEDNVLYQTISTNARKYAEANFDLEQVIDRYEAVLKDAIK